MRALGEQIEYIERNLYKRTKALEEYSVDTYTERNFADVFALFSNPSVIDDAKQLDDDHRRLLDHILFRRIESGTNGTVFDWIAEHAPDDARHKLFELYADRAGEEKVRTTVMVPLSYYGNEMLRDDIKGALLGAHDNMVVEYANMRGMREQLKGSARD